ncbi:MAG: ABC transporter ATP-binding protein [Bacteroidetes bacterium]|nr:ABC transporter ATP-binding protein [Bacteroidota bacterium]
MNQPVIDIRQVNKRFKDVHAVKDLNLTIQAGEFIALLGPNGAGKTTLVEMIEGIQKPDSGSILLFGKTWQTAEQELRRRIGLSLQETRFIDKLTVGETLDLFASFFSIGSERVKEILAQIRLEEKVKAYTVNLSGGQRQRLAIGLALINDPELLLLDEPTTGLDPTARREIWDLLMELKSRKATIILTTHYMEEAEYLCDRIVMMNKGDILASGTLNQLLNEHGGGELIRFRTVTTFQPAWLPVGEKVLSVNQIAETTELVTTDTMAVLKKIMELNDNHQLGLSDLECSKRTLDDLFISMTGHHLSE